MNYFKKAIIIGSVLTVGIAVFALTPVKFDSRTTPSWIYPKSYISEVIRYFPSELTRYDHISGSIIYSDKEGILMDWNGDRKLDTLTLNGDMIARQNTGDERLDRTFRIIIELDQGRNIESRLGTEEEFARYDRIFAEAIEDIN